ncbi:hypothetical protein [Bifidobacterium oedipodis]|uniref:CTP synthase n=1 Tax=Bifidobacterium oedipodis TaxID=2675322 RepID=A0A7Y0HRT8_9BIFI|nr:hypothetical protein [Bifidobacterium sp. DSM 109957]NMM92868.1 CTP synthase [Bifidobacterium sp. DSM 109957]
MKKHLGVAAALAEARRQQRCAYGSDATLRKAFSRRVRNGELISPFRNVFIERDVWNQLSNCERTRYATRTLSILHDHWVFAGLTAADIHGLDHSWRLHNGSVQIVDGKRSGFISQQRIERLYKATVPTVSVGGMIVTDVVCTVIDCCLALPFDQALPIVDSALRNGLTIETLQARCLSLTDGRDDMNRLLKYADARSENGGESWVRAMIVTMGFAQPELQVEFENPDNPYQRYRVDFLWRIHDGRIIVLEFDGTRKYVDPNMTNGRAIRQIVEQQLERDRVLRQAGATTIVHCFLDEVPTQLFDKLKAAGVPWIGRPFS